MPRVIINQAMFVTSFKIVEAPLHNVFCELFITINFE